MRGVVIFLLYQKLCDKLKIELGETNLRNLKTIENYLTRMGGVVKNGHACVLRAICEVLLNQYQHYLFYLIKTDLLENWK